MVKIIKKKFFEVDLPLIGEKYEALSGALAELNGKSIKVDVTRKLKGKSVELVFGVKVNEGKASGIPKRLTLMPFFIKHMLHAGIDYVEDSIRAETLDSEVIIKPFMITRKKVSRAVRRTLRNSAKNWLIDYLKEKDSSEVFQDILSNQLQRPLSLKLKKIYPLAICEIRVFEIKKPLAVRRERTQAPEVQEEQSKEEAKTSEPAEQEEESQKSKKSSKKKEDQE